MGCRLGLPHVLIPGRGERHVSFVAGGSDQKKETMVRPRLFKALSLMAGILVIVACRNSEPAENPLDTLFQSYYEIVQTTVQEPARMEALIDTGMALEPRLHEEFVKLASLYKNLAELNADYSTTRSELDQQLTAIQRSRESMRTLVLEARTEVIALATPEEWELMRERRSQTLIDLLDGDAELY